eukprot:TRINITY_DN50712_c0_g2_i1.p1 TRINITY_DN50712_c0_g2~~TRINITY_DN50712_c0_g2_i1.p1  ORF type:complete len:502 (+),score=87.87 TRINITY_DN50712_c0_g2_i1:131-1636(+)
MTDMERRVSFPDMANGVREVEYQSTKLRKSQTDVKATEAKSKAQHPIEVADRWFASVEDLKVAFQTVLEVNEHLNDQIEMYVQESDMLRTQITKLESHCNKLSDMLRQERRSFAMGSETKSFVSQRKEWFETRMLEKSASQNSTYQDEGDNQVYEEEDIEEEADLSFWQEGEIKKQLEALQSRGDYAGWLVGDDELVMGKALGQGTFGTTYRATWRGSQVAVKSVRIKKPDEAVSFLREVDALSVFRHPNLMPFIGCCLMPPDRCWIVCEYMPGGTLYQWLYGKKGQPRKKRSLEDRLKKALEVARGMQCLEETVPFAYLHRDLKPTNVFIDGAGNARVGDFGLSRRMLPDVAATLTGETGTYIYMAPEVIRHEVYDSKADVYSWGVMFAELVNQRIPYQELYLTPIQVGLAVSDEKLRPMIASSHPQALQTLLESACDFDCDNRPTFKEIVTQLETIIYELFAHNSNVKSQDDSIAGMFGRMLKSVQGVRSHPEEKEQDG